MQRAILAVVLTDSGDAGMSKSDFSGGVDNPIEGGMVLGGVDNNTISSAYSFSGSGGIQSSGSLDEHWTTNPSILLRPTSSGGISLGGLGGAYISNYVGLVSLELGGTSLPFNSTVYLYAGVGGVVMSGGSPSSIAIMDICRQWRHILRGRILSRILCHRKLMLLDLLKMLLHLLVMQLLEPSIGLLLLLPHQMTDRMLLLLCRQGLFLNI